MIRIDDLGRAEAINYHNLEYKPQDAMRQSIFCPSFAPFTIAGIATRFRTIFSKSLYFLDGKLAGRHSRRLPQR